MSLQEEAFLGDEPKFHRVAVCRTAPCVLNNLLGKNKRLGRRKNILVPPHPCLLNDLPRKNTPHNRDLSCAEEGGSGQAANDAYGPKLVLGP